MNSNTLFRWFINRLSFLSVLLVAVASWWLSSIKYDSQVLLIKNKLLSSAMELNHSENLEDKLVNNHNYTIINEDGVMISDKQFGTMASVSFSENFKEAFSGKTVISTTVDEGIDRIECWGLIQYKGKPHVIVIRAQVETSKLKYFLLYFLLFSFLGSLILLCAASLVASPIRDCLAYLSADLKGIYREKFEKKQTYVDTDEFAEVYDKLNTLSSFIQSELSTLRGDLNQWEVFFSTMPRGLIAIDGERYIQNCNANALELLDVKDKDIAEVNGQSVMAVFRNADMNRITSDFFESNKFLEEYEFELVADDLIETIKVLCVELELPGDTDEEKKGAMVIIENITALRRLENMRKDFVSNVSHELKTPIAIVGGFLETIKECLDDKESALRFLEIVEKNTSRLSLIVDDLLNLSKLEQNEALIRKDFESKKISDTVSSAVDVCSHEAKKKKITVNLDLEDSKYYDSETMLANHRLIEQALRNLVENAIRYSPSGSEVTVSSKKINDKIEITVKDSGPGIDKEHHDKIFGRFYRVDKSRDRQTGGSGLGLAIVKHIMRIHNGNVKLESEPGEGASFTLILPYITKSKKVTLAAL